MGSGLRCIEGFQSLPHHFGPIRFIAFVLRVKALVLGTREQQANGPLLGSPEVGGHSSFSNRLPTCLKVKNRSASCPSVFRITTFL